MSDSFPHHSDHSDEALLSVENALVQAWAALENFRQDIVVVGGLAIHYHTRNKANPIYRPAATLDVDFGITLAADAGMAAPAGFALAMANFSENEQGRIFKKSEHGELYLDFLTEHPPRTAGTRNVSDLKASICPGINGALANPIRRAVSGNDHYGEPRTFQIPFCDYGPLLVLKLNAFAGRTSAKKAKDAYDILTLVHSCEDGAERAVASFGKEKGSGNTGMETALETLKNDFADVDATGPNLAKDFYHGAAANDSVSLRLKEDYVTIARALLDA
ncbi:hypothetical protein JIN77_08565 [Verrucomicrobiaceae bacterium R5-34]|nr:hypothetical protein [Verrucomicrobiaceae bacterium R5-34]